MEFNENLDLKEISKFLGEEIKEVSTKKWAIQVISKLMLEKKLNDSLAPTEKEIEDYEELAKKIEPLKDKKREYAFKNMSKENQELMEKVLKYRNDEKSLEQMKENIKEYEDYLEVEVNLKKEIDSKLRTTVSPGL